MEPARETVERERMSVVDMEEVLQECSCATDAAVDSEGYMRSFAVEDREGQCDFFRDFGFVVVHDVLSEEEVAASVDESSVGLASLSFFSSLGLTLHSLAVWRAAARAEQGGGVGEKEVESLRSDPERWSKVLSSSLGIFGGSPATGLVAWRVSSSSSCLLFPTFASLLPCLCLFAC